jgi:hypothetical protein
VRAVRGSLLRRLLGKVSAQRIAMINLDRKDIGYMEAVEAVAAMLLWNAPTLDVLLFRCRVHHYRGSRLRFTSPEIIDTQHTHNHPSLPLHHTPPPTLITSHKPTTPPHGLPLTSTLSHPHSHPTFIPAHCAYTHTHTYTYTADPLTPAQQPLEDKQMRTRTRQ